MANQKSFTPTCALVFQRSFTQGHLAGLVIADYISFVSTDLRLDWLKGVRANQESGKLDWLFEGEIFYYSASLSRDEAIADYEIWAN